MLFRGRLCYSCFLFASSCGQRKYIQGVFSVTQYNLCLCHSISISVIWALASRTNLLSDDPILWFSMMLMPTGPPAISLTSMADCTGSSEKEIMAIAKFLTVSRGWYSHWFSSSTLSKCDRLPTPFHRSSASPLLAVSKLLKLP